MITTYPSPSLLQVDSSPLSVGEEVMGRRYIASVGVTIATGVLQLSYFTARKTEVTTQARVVTGGTAAAATPTICRFGLYSIAANGDGALVASIVNDTTLFAATSTAYTRSWSSSYTKLAGQRYALGLIVVSGVAVPSFMGVLLGTGPSTESSIAPRITSRLTAQTDLPSTFTDASLLSTATNIYGAVLP